MTKQIFPIMVTIFNMADYNKIMFSEMPPILLEETVPDASPTDNIATNKV